MRSSELIEFLEMEGDVQELKRKLSSALSFFRNALKTRGGSAPIELTTEGKEVVVKASHLRKICAEFIAGSFDEIDVEYIATALALCPDFAAESEEVQDAIYSLSDLRQLKPHELEIRVNEILESIL